MVIATPPAAQAWENPDSLVTVNNLTTHVMTFQGAWQDGDSGFGPCQSSNSTPPNHNAQFDVPNFSLYSSSETCTFWRHGFLRGLEGPEAAGEWRLSGTSDIHWDANVHITATNEYHCQARGDAAKLVHCSVSSSHDSWGPGTPPTGTFDIQAGELTAAVVSGVQVARRAPREDPAYDAPASASSVTKSQGNVNAYVRVVTNVPNKKGWTNARVTASVPGGSRSSVITRLKTEQAKMVEVPLDLATVSRLRAGKSVSAMVSVKPLGDKSATGDRDTAVLTHDGQYHETE